MRRDVAEIRPAIATLPAEARDIALGTLPGWAYDDARSALFRRIELEDFSAAFGLMARIALAADKADHHPEWSNVCHRIDIWLTTHDAGGVTLRDVALARSIEALL